MYKYITSHLRAHTHTYQSSNDRTKNEIKPTEIRKYIFQRYAFDININPLKSKKYIKTRTHIQPAYKYTVFSDARVQ